MPGRTTPEDPEVPDETTIEAIRSFSLNEKDFGLACAILYGQLDSAADIAGVDKATLLKWVGDATPEEIVSIRDMVKDAMGARIWLLIDYHIPEIVKRIKSGKDPWPVTRSYCALLDRANALSGNNSSDASKIREVRIEIPGVIEPQVVRYRQKQMEDIDVSIVSPEDSGNGNGSET